MTVRGTLDETGGLATFLDGEGLGRLVICTSGEEASTRFEFLVFQGGSAPDADGGAVLLDGGSPAFEWCSFIGNSALNGGALAVIGGGPVLVDCWFESNIASEGGGALYAYGAAPQLVDSIFVTNTAIDGLGGALLAYFGSELFLEGCSVITNSSGATGGGLYITNSSFATLRDTLVCGNTPNQLVGPHEAEGATCIREACDEDCEDLCPADLTGDDLVDGEDLVELLGVWGACVDPDECLSDLDGNGLIDGADLLELLSAWGFCP